VVAHRRGGGGGLFNQNTPFDLSPIIGLSGTVLRTLVERMADYITVKDFGAACDGITDDTAAVNACISAINAGVISVMRLPGFTRVTGSLTTITKSFEIVGVGMGHSGFIHQGGDVTMISVAFTVNLVRCSLHDFSFRSDQACLGQPFYAHQNTFNLTSSLNIENVDVTGTATRGKGFKRGIELVNISNATFFNANVYGYVDLVAPFPTNTTMQQWAWNVWAEPAFHSVNNRWTDCDVTWVAQAWQGLSGDLQGFSWVTCCPVFLGNGWKFTPDVGVADPYFEWVNCQSECYATAIYLVNVSWVTVADCVIFTDSNFAGTQYAIYVQDAVGAYAHDNVINCSDGVGGALGTTSGIVFNNVNQGLTHHNGIRGFKGYGVRFTGTTQNCMTEMDWIVSPVAGATIYANDGANAILNKRRRMQITNWASDPGDVSASFGTTTVGITPTSMITCAMPCVIGDELELQGYAYYQPFGANADCIVYERLRELTHSPGSPIPFQIIEFAATKNNVTQTNVLDNRAGSAYLEAFIMLDATVRVIATAADAVITLDAWSSNTFINVSGELRVVRR
jgi:hypothetical protein